MKHSWLNNISKYRLLRVLSRIYLKKVHFMPIGGIDGNFEFHVHGDNINPALWHVIVFIE
jgi:hypothetical protein